MLYFYSEVFIFFFEIIPFFMLHWLKIASLFLDQKSFYINLFVW